MGGNNEIKNWWFVKYVLYLHKIGIMKILLFILSLFFTVNVGSSQTIKPKTTPHVHKNRTYKPVRDYNLLKSNYTKTSDTTVNYTWYGKSVTYKEYRDSLKYVYYQYCNSLIKKTL